MTFIHHGSVLSSNMRSPRKSPFFRRLVDNLSVALNPPFAAGGTDGRPTFAARRNRETNVTPQVWTNSVLTTVRFRYAGRPPNPASETVNGCHSLLSTFRQGDSRERDSPSAHLHPNSSIRGSRGFRVGGFYKPFSKCKTKHPFFEGKKRIPFF